MMRYFFIGLAFCIATIVFVAGVRGHKFTSPPVEIFNDMVRQPKFKAQAPSSFFADGRADRPPPPGVVPVNAVSGIGIPFHVDRAVMLRGQERYGIYCAACHGATGQGDGIVSQYGMVAIANLNQKRISTMPEGDIFNTISNGKGAMLGFGDRIPVPDRWAIICYIRALQKSQGASLSDVPPEELSRLKGK